MPYKKSVILKARAELQNRRQQAENIAENKKQELFAAFPEAQEINMQIANCGTSAAKAVVKGANVAVELEKLRQKSLFLQNEFDKILMLNGYPKEYLDVHYTCQKCKDTGEIELHSKTILCDCYKSLLTNITYDELNSASPLKLSTFESFKLDYYSMDLDGNQSPYNRMTKIFNYCKKYAAEFTPASKSLLMRGLTGLGKTHLSLAIANEVIKKGYGVIYVSAPSIMQKLEREHFGNKSAEEFQTLSSLENCDLLIIDDLGTEFNTSFTSATIYNIFNTRILTEKPTIINTNLQLDELTKIYTQRFVSRIVGCAEKLDFLGEDVRIKKAGF